MAEVFRKEVKYSISYATFFAARPMLDACMQRDPHCMSGEGYTVRSLYFDSSYDADLFAVLDGLLSKQKVRLRCYNVNDESLKLEYKCKTGTDSRKLSVGVSRPDTERMLRGEYGFLMELHNPVASELYARLKCGAYIPRVVVAYRRFAYIASPNDVRVTFDYDTRASLVSASLLDADAALVPVSPPGSGVLEVKYNGFLPQYISDVLQSMNISPTSNSKYAESRLTF